MIKLLLLWDHFLLRKPFKMLIIGPPETLSSLLTLLLRRKCLLVSNTHPREMQASLFYTCNHFPYFSNICVNLTLIFLPFIF